jgi:hypothetical protein
MSRSDKSCSPRLREQEGDFYDAEKELIPRLTKRIAIPGDYVEK